MLYELAVPLFFVSRSSSDESGGGRAGDAPKTPQLRCVYLKQL